MKALQFVGQTLELVEVPRPELKNGEALVRVLKAGVCNTDIEITKGYFEFSGILGHEFIGVVEKVDDQSWLGSRVVADINCACRKCPTCEAGGEHHCPHRSVLGILDRDGAFADYVSVPLENLVAVPDDLKDEVAAFAEPVAAALEIQEQLSLDNKEEVCVIGDGKLGLLIASTLNASGYEVHIVGRHPEREERLASFNGSYDKKAPLPSYQTVVEATGNPDGFNLALELTRPRGNLVLKSTYAEGFKFNPAMVVVNELNLVGSRCGPMVKAVDLLASQKIDPLALVDHRFCLSDGVEAMDIACQKGVLKVLLDIS